MVRNHVAQGTRRLVEAGAALDTNGFGDRDLHMIDMIAVPHRLEDAVGKAQHHDVLDRLFAEEVVHPIDLGFRHAPQDRSIQRAGRGEIAAEWLFYDDASEAVTILLRKAD